MRRHLRSAVAGKDAFVVVAADAAIALTSFEVGEVPDVHADHERTGVSGVEIAFEHEDLIFLAPQFGGFSMCAGDGIRAEFADHHRFAQRGVERVQFAGEDGESLVELSALRVPSIVAVDADHIGERVPIMRGAVDAHQPFAA